jgi:hypothetical protein
LDSKLEDKKILQQITARIPRLQPVLNFFMNGILICYDCSQISELFHTFEGFVTYLHVVIPSCNTQSNALQILFNIAQSCLYISRNRPVKTSCGTENRA